MTEKDYIKVSNKTALMAISAIAADLMHDPEYGISRKDYQQFSTALCNMKESVFKSIPGLEQD